MRTVTSQVSSEDLFPDFSLFFISKPLKLAIGRMMWMSGTAYPPELTSLLTERHPWKEVHGM
jgi:hypothetical protein